MAGLAGQECHGFDEFGDDRWTLPLEHDGVDGDVASAELVGDRSCDRCRCVVARRVCSAGRPSEADARTEDVDDRAAVTKLTRRLPVHDERAENACRQRRTERVEAAGGTRTETDLSAGVDDDVDAPERLDRLSEQPLDVELVGDVAANGERGAVRGEDLLDGGLGATLVPDVVHDDGVAPTCQRAHDVTAETARASRDDRHAAGVCRVVGGRGHTAHCGPLTVAATPGQSRVESLVVTLRGTMVTQRQPLFRGRRSERDVLDRLLDQVREGQSAALVIHGEAGVGKTALVRYAVRQASGFRVAEIAGVESEMELAYAGVHQLCTPMLAHLGALAEPQQRAVLIAFGLSSGDAPDRFLVALATLSLLAQVADERPLLCVVEDAQWLDEASGQVLGFVARRLLRESVAMVFAVREPSDQSELVGLPDLPLSGLLEADARALLATVVPGRLDEFIRDRIIAETHGNPLALLELPRGMSVAELSGGFALPDTGDLPSHIEEHFRRRLASLPEPTRRLMLVAAADPVGDATLVWRAAQALGIETDAGAPAATGQLLEIAARVRFPHPLVRSAVYRSSSAADRQVTHNALAAATDAESDPDRRAWHRAQATSGPDEEVAAELEHSAGRAQARGGLAAAAAFLERSATLTFDPAHRGERMLAAAQFNVQAGAFDAALGLLAAAESGPLDDFGHARVDLLRAQVALASRRGNEATPLLLAAARRLEHLDLDLARGTYVDAFAAALFGGRLNDLVDVPDVARAARAVPRRSDGEPMAADLLLDAFSALSEDYDTAVPRCRHALQQICGDATSPAENLRWLWHATVIALELWDDETSFVASHDHLEIARRTGALSELWVALSSRTPVLVFCGDLSGAAALVAEAQSVSEATGISGAPYGGLILAAWRGEVREATELIEVTMREASSRGEGIGIAVS